MSVVKTTGHRWHGKANPSRRLIDLLDARPASANAPDLAYLVCTAPRTGSTLLFDALVQTGIAGQPDEFFDHRRWLQLRLMERLGIENDRSYFNDVLKLATSPNGVCGLKIHWHQVAALREKILCMPELPERWLDTFDLYDALHLGFPRLRFVWLRRKNMVAQAISLWRASETGVWWKEHGATSKPPALQYDFARIHRDVELILKYDRSWKRFFDRFSIEPLEISYEEFIGNYRDTVAMILRLLGLSLDEQASLSPALLQQADEQSHEWEARYRREAAARVRPSEAAQ